MAYNSQLEKFDVVGRSGKRCAVEFRKAGFLTTGDQPELYFFRVAFEEQRDPEGSSQDVVVGISGSSLRRVQQRRGYLSREAKIDLAALLLKKRIESGTALDPQNLLLRDEELAQLAGELGIPV